MALSTTSTLSLCFSIDHHQPYNHGRQLTKLFTFSTSTINKSPHRYRLSSTSSSQGGSYSFLEDPHRPNRFLTNEELEKVKSLESFNFYQELPSGYLSIRVMGSHEMDLTTMLLAESFAESMLMPYAYQKLLRFLVKQYLIERRAALPHAVTLVGYFRTSNGNGNGNGNDNDDDVEEELAGTVEVCFDKRGSNSSPPTPTPPKNSPYICNMTVKDQFRRKGIGWNLLKASEELISQMSSTKEAYLHCRMIDSAPFNMYTKAGYNVVETDSILTLLLLQRRKHLMYKKLPVVISPLEPDDTEFEEELSP